MKEGNRMKNRDVNLLCLTEGTWEGQLINTSSDRTINFFIKKDKCWFDKMHTRENYECVKRIMTVLKELNDIKSQKTWDTFEFKEEHFDSKNDMYTVTYEKGGLIFDFHYYGSLENVSMFIYMKGTIIDESKSVGVIELEDADKSFDKSIFKEVLLMQIPQSKHRIRLVNWRG